jgi:apolipoprotein N-acyltransferase
MKAKGGTRREEQQAAFSLVTGSCFIYPPRGHRSLVTAFLLGAATVLAYAPFELFPLPVVTLAALFVLWQRPGGARSAAKAGFAYGLGLFLFGVSWVYVSLHNFGAMPMPLAAAATLLFCAVLALLPALAGYLYGRLAASGFVKLALAAPALWTLAEWTRGWIFTGFPWLAVGYAQVPVSPLAGYAPVLGVYGVSLATAVSAGLIAVLWQRWNGNDERGMMNEKTRNSPSPLIS